jgi:hypothetical protein
VKLVFKQKNGHPWTGPLADIICPRRPQKTPKPWQTESGARQLSHPFWSEAHLIGHEFTNPWPQKAAPKSLKPILHVVFWLFNSFDDKCQLEFAIYFNMDIFKQCPNSSRESGQALEKRNYFPPRGPRGKVTLLSTSASAITYTAHIYRYI